MSQALVLSGAGRYADPWHPFAETSPILARIAREAGWDAEITDSIDATLANGLGGVDLLIINAGDPWRNSDEPACDGPAESDEIDRGRAALKEAFLRGIGILGIHTAASSLRDYPQFRDAFGFEWVPNLSWHPPFGLVNVGLTPEAVVQGLPDFEVTDERYTDLITKDGYTVLGFTSDPDKTYALIFSRRYGQSQIYYDALGHDTTSYDSPGHVHLLARLLETLQPHDRMKG